MIRIFFLILFFIFITASCSLNKLVVGQMTPVLEKSADALYEETDLKLAEQALASNLKLLEGLLKNDPENEKMNLLLAQGYSGYALGFVEDEDPLRAADFYERAFNYGLRVLIDEYEAEWQWNQKNIQKLNRSIEEVEKENVAALFWTTFALAGKINVSLNDPAELSRLPVIEKMIDQIEKTSPDFFYGAVYLLKGSIAGMKPRMLGGNPEKALEYFDKNIAMTNGTFLLSFVYKAKFYAAKVLDEDLFDALLAKIETAEKGAPELALFNQIARKKAALLKEKREDLF